MILLCGLSFVFFVIGVVIIWKQLRAKDCPIHNPLAGRVAVICAVVAFICSTLVLALLLTADR